MTLQSLPCLKPCNFPIYCGPDKAVKRPLCFSFEAWSKNSHVRVRLTWKGSKRPNHNPPPTVSVYSALWFENAEFFKENCFFTYLMHQFPLQFVWKWKAVPQPFISTQIVPSVLTHELVGTTIVFTEKSALANKIPILAKETILRKKQHTLLFRHGIWSIKINVMYSPLQRFLSPPLIF